MTALANRIVGSGEEAPDQLLANPLNWRIHPKRQQRALEAALEQVGWVQQVIVNRVTGHVVDGHLRVAVAITRAEPMVPVLYVELSPEEERLVLASLDPLAGLAVTDAEMFAELTEGLAVPDEDLAKLLGLDNTREGRTDPDEPPPLPDPVSEPGDLWELGEHRLLVGDCTEPADVERLLGPDRVALVATDPPYGVDYSAIVDSRTNQKAGGWRDIAGDETPEPGPELAGAALNLARPHAAEGCAIFVWHPAGENAGVFRTAITSAGVHILKEIVWVKPVLVFGRHEYHWRHESAFYGWYEGSRARFHGDRSETTVWEVAPSPGFLVRNGPAFRVGGLGDHPTQKPVELTARPIRNHTSPGEAVYEPFCGSGSALIAAEQQGRRCLAMEIDPLYCDATVKRWEAFTGREAIRA